MKKKLATKKQLKLIEKIFKSTDLNLERLLASQTIGTSIFRLLRKTEDFYYFSIDRDYFFKNRKNNEVLIFNTIDSEELNSDKDLDKLLKKLV